MNLKQLYLYKYFAVTADALVRTFFFSLKKKKLAEDFPFTKINLANLLQKKPLISQRSYLVGM